MASKSFASLQLRPIQAKNPLDDPAPRLNGEADLVRVRAHDLDRPPSNLFSVSDVIRHRQEAKSVTPAGCPRVGATWTRTTTSRAGAMCVPDTGRAPWRFA